MDVALIDCILRHYPVNLGYSIIQIILSIPKLITRSLLYGHFITQILKHLKALINEPSCRPSQSIRDKAVYALRFEWSNGAWVKFTKNKYTFLASVDVETLQCLPQLPMPLRLLYHL